MCVKNKCVHIKLAKYEHLLYANIDIYVSLSSPSLFQHAVQWHIHYEARNNLHDLKCFLIKDISDAEKVKRFARSVNFPTEATHYF